jgi:hypothetical protein
MKESIGFKIPRIVPLKWKYGCFWGQWLENPALKSQQRQRLESVKSSNRCFAPKNLLSSRNGSYVGAIGMLKRVAML